MVTGQKMLMLALLIGTSVTVSACSVEIDRNADGSLTVNSVMTEASLQDELTAAMNNPAVRDLTVDLRDGYIFVTSERENPETGEVGTVTFRLDLGVADGHLTMTTSDAQFDGEPIDAERLARLNERITDRLERAAGRRPNRTLQSVTISEDTLTMVWRVETWRSRSGE